MQQLETGSVDKMSGCQKFCRVGRAFRVLCVVVLLACFAFKGFSAPAFDTQNPVSFFTNVASRLVMDGLQLDLGRLQVYPTNQYTPAVQRLLQVTANIYQATTTNVFPVVFRPVFSSDEAGTTVYISGYQQVVSVSGIADAQLASPVEAASLVNSQTPFTNLAVNVYGIPWIIAAKKGLPNFNQFYTRNTFQITRKLQVTRSTASIGAIASGTGTNQMFIMSITNRLGFSFWNSYNEDYVPVSGNVTVHFGVLISMSMTNVLGGYPAFTGSLYNNPASYISFSTNFVFSSWPGSAWTNSITSSPEYQTAVPQSFVSGFWDFAFLSESQYVQGASQFVSPLGPWENLAGAAPPILPQFGLATTNLIQAYILDGTNVIDYVQMTGSSLRNLSEEIRDPYGLSSTLMWVTNGYNNSALPPTVGVVNQIYVSRYNPPGSLANSWKRSVEMPGAFNTPTLEAAYFNAFYTGGSVRGADGKFYPNTNLVLQAPYTPTRSAWELTLYQANDPLVHYLASALATHNRDTGLQKTDDLVNSKFSQSNPQLNYILDRYQPWGITRQLAQVAPNIDTNSFNSRFRDPLVWGSDYWNFPVGQNWNLNWIGHIHRGTPWQTIYLKDRNVLDESFDSMNVGTNTWQAWTGVSSPLDTQLTSPTTDWHLVSVLAALLNTNDLRLQFSVNNSDASAWASLMDGFNVLTNTTETPFSAIVPTFDALMISSNAPQAAVIASAIQALHPGQPFREIGEVLAVPQLSGVSPYLNWSDSDQTKYAINDEAYEKLPSQLLPLLRADSIGSLAASNGSNQIQFTGYDNHSYAIEVSSDLKLWSPISTNSPVNGVILLNLPIASTQQFYRSCLLQ
jgi:hypothetical protein